MRSFVSLIFALVLLAAPAAAQTVTTEVNGTVKDEAGALVAGATVKLTDAATAREVTTTSNDDGYYVFANVRPGVYKLAVEQAGFKRSEVPDVKVDVGVPASINFQLTPGGVDETVTVTSADAQAAINSTNAELSTTVHGAPDQRPAAERSQPARPGDPPARRRHRRLEPHGHHQRPARHLLEHHVGRHQHQRQLLPQDSLFGSAGRACPASPSSRSPRRTPARVMASASRRSSSSPRAGRTSTTGRAGSTTATTSSTPTVLQQRRRPAEGEAIRNQFGVGVGGPFVLPRFGEGGPRTYGQRQLFFYATTRRRASARTPRSTARC